MATHRLRKQAADRIVPAGAQKDVVEIASWALHFHPRVRSVDDVFAAAESARGPGHRG